MSFGTLEECVKSYRSGCQDFTNNGKCSGCGQCCSDLLPLSKKEIEIIRKYIHTHQIKRQQHKMPFAKAADFDLCCPFMDISKEKKCTIYEVRPQICKSFLCCRKDFDNELLNDDRFPVIMSETFFG